ncbi:MAG: hypothetical protein WCI57_04215 [Candidatus Berkelbacteria bacterium]
MPNTLTVSYFVGEFKIPDITGSSPVATANANNLKWFIAKYEPKFLKMLLGEDLAAAFLAGITVTAPAVPAAKWTALKNKIFVEDSTNSLYLSPAANFVYYHVMRDRITFTTSAGEVQPNNNSKTPVQQTNNRMKMVQAWNQMSEDVLVLWQWLEDNIETYPEFDPYQPDPFEYELQEISKTINMFNIGV